MCMKAAVTLCTVSPAVLVSRVAPGFLGSAATCHQPLRGPCHLKCETTTSECKQQQQQQSQPQMGPCHLSGNEDNMQPSSVGLSNLAATAELAPQRCNLVQRAALVPCLTMEVTYMHTN
jgi:hypothetical protein